MKDYKTLYEKQKELIEKLLPSFNAYGKEETAIIKLISAISALEDTDHVTLSEEGQEVITSVS